MLDAYSSEYYRGEIFPVRWKKRNDDEHHPIACGAAMAFWSGFLDIAFRHHDFFLGRDNARNFYRTYFTLEYNKAKGIVHPIHASWTDDMVNLFKRPGKDGSVYLPIVPDLYMLKEKWAGGKERNPFDRSVPQWPQYDAAKLLALKDKMEARVKLMLDLTYKKMNNNVAGPEHPLTAAWMSKYYRSNWFKKLTGRIGSGVLEWLFKMNKGKIAGRVTQSAIEWILKDLEAAKLLVNPNNHRRWVCLKCTTGDRMVNALQTSLHALQDQFYRQIRIRIDLHRFILVFCFYPILPGQ